MRDFLNVTLIAITAAQWNHVGKGGRSQNGLSRLFPIAIKAGTRGKEKSCASKKRHSF